MSIVLVMDARHEAQLCTLRREDVRRHLGLLQALAADIPGEYWGEEHFLCNLPEKWRLSFAAWSGNGLEAYAILSRKSPARAHLHHLMVAAARRGQGLGTRMVADMERRVRDLGCSHLTLKVHESNDGARRFYARLGFDESERQGDYVVMGKSVV